MFVLAFPLGTTVTLRMFSSGFYGVTATKETCSYTIMERPSTYLRGWEPLQPSELPRTEGASSGVPSGDKRIGKETA